MKTYKVNEIFYSVQAEGRNAGTPAIFIRFAGCNLTCSFCDTNHEPYKEMTKDEIEQEVASFASTHFNSTTLPVIVFTGGEPTVQLSEEEELCRGYYRAIETNGIIPPPSWIEWVTISPKTKLTTAQLSKANEIKVLCGHFPEEYVIEVGKLAEEFKILCYMQPIADKNGKFDVTSSIHFCQRYPYWKLSLQWHKVFNIR